MLLSDTSIKRPVFASVISILLVAFGLVAFERLTLREYPDIDPPVVSIRTGYPGAAASIVETRITKVIEDRISGVEGIRYIESTSENGRSNIIVQFDVGQDMDAAANDIRDRVSRVLGNLPQEADPPEVEKVSSDEDVILWFNFTSDSMTTPELSDYAQRYLVDRFSVVNGVARVRIGGEKRYAMSIWLDRRELAARNLTVNDVEEALRAENIELPAGSIESADRQFTVRMARNYLTADDFARLAIHRGAEKRYAMRIWLDRCELAARNQTVIDVEDALRAKNIELPAGSIESADRQLTVRMARIYLTSADFACLAIDRGADVSLIRLGDV